MRALLALMLIGSPVAAAEDAADDDKATIQFLGGLRDRETGAFKQTATEKPSLRATNGAVKALKALGHKLTDIEKIQKFILGCYDAKTGAFAEPDGKPDATITSIGIIVAREVGVDKKEFPKAMEYLLANAKTFEEARIGAAAVEAWGRDGLKLEGLTAIVKEEHDANIETFDKNTPFLAAIIVTARRLLEKRPDSDRYFLAGLYFGQLKDGGWGKIDEKASDIESTYRVMRAFKMLEVNPNDIPQLRKFLASHRNKDGGAAVKPGGTSSASGTYYTVIVSKWLDEMDAKK